MKASVTRAVIYQPYKESEGMQRTFAWHGPVDGLGDRVPTGGLEVQCLVGPVCRYKARTSVRTESDEVCRGCALSVELPVAKWRICNNVVG